MLLWLATMHTMAFSNTHTLTPTWIAFCLMVKHWISFRKHIFGVRASVCLCFIEPSIPPSPSDSHRLKTGINDIIPANMHAYNEQRAHISLSKMNCAVASLTPSLPHACLCVPKTFCMTYSSVFVFRFRLVFIFSSLWQIKKNYAKDTK